MRRLHRDGNHARIVAALEAVGCSVLELQLHPFARKAKGAPDILAGRGRRLQVLMEIKDPDGEDRLSEAQVAWHGWWRGLPVVVVRTEAEALAAVGVPDNCK